MGAGIANPLATILSAAMMLDWLDLPEYGDAIRNAVRLTLADPACRTKDLGGRMTCRQMTDEVLQRV